MYQGVHKVKEEDLVMVVWGHQLNQIVHVGVQEVGRCPSTPSFFGAQDISFLKKEINHLPPSLNITVQEQLQLPQLHLCYVVLQQHLQQVNDQVPVRAYLHL